MDEMNLAFLPLIPIILSALSIAGSYAASRSAQKTAKYNTDATIAANKQMSEYAYSKDLEMFNKANEYNSPEAQQLRLSKANLNPNLVYGSGSVAGNTTGQLPKYNAPQQEYNYAPDVALARAGESLPEMLSKYQDFAMRQAQIDNVRAQTSLTSQQSDAYRYQDAILAAKAQAEPVRTAMTDMQMEQMKRLQPYQLEVVKGQAGRQGLINQSMLQQMSSREQDIVFKKLQNEWMRSGVTGRDSIFMRMLVRQFPDLFTNLFKK